MLFSQKIKIIFLGIIYCTIIRSDVFGMRVDESSEEHKSVIHSLSSGTADLNEDNDPEDEELRAYRSPQENRGCGACLARVGGRLRGFFGGITQRVGTRLSKYFSKHPKLAQCTADLTSMSVEAAGAACVALVILPYFGVTPSSNSFWFIFLTIRGSNIAVNVVKDKGLGEPLVLVPQNTGLRLADLSLLTKVCAVGYYVVLIWPQMPSFHPKMDVVCEWIGELVTCKSVSTESFGEFCERSKALLKMTCAFGVLIVLPLEYHKKIISLSDVVKHLITKVKTVALTAPPAEIYEAFAKDEECSICAQPMDRLKNFAPDHPKREPAKLVLTYHKDPMGRVQHVFHADCYARYQPVSAVRKQCSQCSVLRDFETIVLFRDQLKPKVD